MKRKFTIEGQDSGLHVVRLHTGERHHLTEDQLKTLKKRGTLPSAPAVVTEPSPGLHPFTQGEDQNQQPPAQNAEPKASEAPAKPRVSRPRKPAAAKADEPKAEPAKPSRKRAAKAAAKSEETPGMIPTVGGSGTGVPIA